MNPSLRALALAQLLLVACSSSEGGPSGTGGDGGQGGESSGATFGDGACSTCVTEACSAEITTCNADPGCAGWLTCLRACPLGAEGDADAACESACALDGSAAVAARDALVTCRTSGPGDDCAACGPAGEGGGGGSPPAICELPAALTQECAPSDEADECNRCQYDSCCESVEKVFGPGPAGDLAQCWAACTTTACEDECFATYPDGIPGFGEYEACAAVHCQATERCSVSNPCNQCRYEECGCETAACLTDPECFLIFHCFAACDEVACGQACQDQHPEGVVLFETLTACTAQRCVEVCGGG